MSDQDARIIESLEELKDGQQELRDMLKGIGQETGLVGQVEQLENDRIDPRVFERMSVKMNIICWIGAIIGLTLIAGIVSGWRFNPSASAATAQLAYPSTLADVFDDLPAPRMGIDRAAYVEEIWALESKLTAMKRIAKDSVAANGPIDGSGWTWPHPTPSFTRTERTE